MKKSDWAAIVLIVGVTALASYFIVGLFIKSPKDNLQSVATAPSFNSEVDAPSKEIFNETAVNPTVKVTIGNQADTSKSVTSKEEEPFDVGSE